MAIFNAADELYELCELDGKPVAFTNMRLDRQTVPDGLYCYDVRDSDNCDGSCAEVKEFVMVNNKQPPHNWGCKEEHTMKIIEIMGRIAEDGSILLPPGVLESMSMGIGDTVHLAYLSHHPVKQINSYGEFFITKDGIDHVSEPVEAPDTAQLSVPHALLEAAGIPLDDDLDITVSDGCIMIGSSDPLYRLPPALIDLFISLGVSPETVRSVLEGGDEDE